MGQIVKAGRLDGPVWNEPPQVQIPGAPRLHAGRRQWGFGVWSSLVGGVLLVAGGMLPWVALPCNDGVTCLQSAASVDVNYDVGLKGHATICLLCGVAICLLLMIRLIPWKTAVGLSRLGSITAGGISLVAAVTAIPVMRVFARHFDSPSFVGIEPVAFGLVMAMVGAICLIAGGLVPPPKVVGVT
jgi:hypothetical protein